MRYGVVALVFLLVIAGVLAPQHASAIKPFFEQFKAVYVKPKTTDHTMKIFNAAVEKKGCTICHLPKPQKGFNAYGSQFKKFLTKNDGQNTSKIRTSITKVARLKSDPNDPDSLTFGKRLGEGKLPVGEIHVRSAAHSK
jgi:hypothetical protein